MIYEKVFRKTTWFVYRRLPQFACTGSTSTALSLLYTCRKINTEARLFPYYQGTFHIGFLVGAIAHSFLQNRSPMQLQAIRSLQGDELLSSNLRFLDALPNLEKLEMILEGNHFIVQMERGSHRIEVLHFTYRWTRTGRNELRFKLEDILRAWKPDAKIVFTK